MTAARLLPLLLSFVFAIGTWAAHGPRALEASLFAQDIKSHRTFNRDESFKDFRDEESKASEAREADAAPPSSLTAVSVRAKGEMRRNPQDPPQAESLDEDAHIKKQLYRSKARLDALAEMETSRQKAASAAANAGGATANVSSTGASASGASAGGASSGGASAGDSVDSFNPDLYDPNGRPASTDPGGVAAGDRLERAKERASNNQLLHKNESWNDTLDDLALEQMEEEEELFELFVMEHFCLYLAQVIALHTAGFTTVVLVILVCNQRKYRATCGIGSCMCVFCCWPWGGYVACCLPVDEVSPSKEERELLTGHPVKALHSSTASTLPTTAAAPLRPSPVSMPPTTAVAAQPVPEPQLAAAPEPQPTPEQHPTAAAPAPAPATAQ